MLGRLQHQREARVSVLQGNRVVAKKPCETLGWSVAAVTTCLEVSGPEFAGLEALFEGGTERTAEAAPGLPPS